MHWTNVSFGNHFWAAKKEGLHTTFGICDGRILAFRHADTDVDKCFIVEDNICRLIINVKPELKMIKDLLTIALPSSPAIANTFVSCRLFCRVSYQSFHQGFLVINFCTYSKTSFLKFCPFKTVQFTSL